MHAVVVVEEAVADVDRRCRAGDAGLEQLRPGLCRGRQRAENNCRRDQKQAGAMTEHVVSSVLSLSLSYCALMLAALMTFSHFSPSARICCAKSSGEPPTGSRPRTSKRSFTS